MEVNAVCAKGFVVKYASRIDIKVIDAVVFQ